MTLTQILQKIRNAFYTKKEIDSMGGGASLSDTISQKADKSDLVNYFPKSGGLMTGTTIGRDVDDSRLTIRGASSYTKGSYLVLSGKDGDLGGNFNLIANDGTSSVALNGIPNGTLTWGNKNLDVIEEQGDGYIRYSNGLQICWGQTNCSIGTDTSPIGVDTRAYYGSMSASFGSAFKAGTSPCCTITVIDTETGLYGSCATSITNARVVIEIYGGKPSVSLNAQYIAIGKWK